MAVAAGAATLRKTIEDYDAYVMGTADSLEVEKLLRARHGRRG